MIDNYKEYSNNLDEKIKNIRLIQSISQKRAGLFDFVKDEFLRMNGVKSHFFVEYFDKVFSIPYTKIISEVFYIIENYLLDQNNADNYIKLEEIDNAIANICESNSKKGKNIENFVNTLANCKQNYRNMLEYAFESRLRFYNALIEDYMEYENNCLESLKIKNIHTIVNYFFDDYCDNNHDNEYTSCFCDFVSNSLELEEALNFIIANNLSPLKESALSKIQYIELLKSKLTDKHFRNVIFLLLDSIRSNYEFEINFYKNIKDEENLFFCENSKIYIDELEDILKNNLYLKFCEKETVRNIIYTIAILNNKENNIWVSLMLHGKNHINYIEEITNNLIDVRKHFLDFDKDKYTKEIKQLENFKNYVLPLLTITEKMYFWEDYGNMGKFIENKNKLEDYFRHMISKRISNMCENITKKIDSANFIISLIDKNSYCQELIKLILSNLKNEFNEKLNSIENDNLDSYYLKMNNTLDFIDELEKNLCYDYNYKEYLNDYRETEEIRLKIGDIGLNANFNNDTEEKEGFEYLVNKIIKDKNKFEKILDKEIYIYEIFLAGKEKYEKDEKEIELCKKALKLINLFKKKIFNIYEAVKDIKDKKAIETEISNFITFYNNVKKNLFDFIKNWSFKRRFFDFASSASEENIVRRNIVLECIEDIEIELDSKTEGYEDKLLIYNYNLLKEIKFRINEVYQGVDQTEYNMEYKITDKIKNLCTEGINKNSHNSYLLSYIVLNVVKNPNVYEKIFNNLEEEINKYSQTKEAMDSIIGIENVREVLCNNRNDVFTLTELIKDLDSEEERKIKINEFCLQKYHLPEYLFDIALSILKLDQEHFIKRITILKNILLEIKKKGICIDLSEVVLKVNTKLREKIEIGSKDEYETLYNTKCLEYFESLSESIVNDFNESWLNRYCQEQKILSYIDCILNDGYDNKDFSILNYKENIIYFAVSKCYDSIESIFSYYESLYNSLIEINKQSENTKEVNRIETLKSKFNTLVSEIKPIIEKYKDFTNKYNTKSFIELDIITEEDIASVIDIGIELFVNSLDENNKIKNSTDLDFEISRFKLLGFLYRNGKCDMVTKIINNKINELNEFIKSSIYASFEDKATNYSIVLEYLDKFKENITKTEIEFNYFCDVDLKLWFYLRCLRNNFNYLLYHYQSSYNNENYKKSSNFMMNLIILSKQYGTDELNRVCSNIVNIITEALEKYKCMVSIDFCVNFETNIINSIKNYVTKIINYINCDDSQKFKSKLYDVFEIIEIISTIYVYYNNMALKITIFIEEEIKKLANIIRIYDSSILTFVFDLIYVTEEEYFLNFKTNYTSPKLDTDFLFYFEEINKFIIDKINDYNFYN